MTFAVNQRIRYRSRCTAGGEHWYVGTIREVREGELVVACEHKRGTHYVDLARSVVEGVQS